MTAQSVYDRLTPAQRVGQLFMIGTTATTVQSNTLRFVRDGLAGSVILTGRSTLGVAATAAVTHGLQAAAQSAGVPGLFVAADQEGGEVQVLRGPGFDDMPSALEQGRSAATALHTDAARWGRQLAAAGVNLDLGPVMDTVADSADPSKNPPIGGYDREFGFAPADVSRHGTAVIAGLADGGVAATAKHFPGLGRVGRNTDYSSDVVDTRTTRTDPFLAPFRDAIAAKVPFIMMSTATYTRIDPSGPAAFSHTAVTDLLRHDLGFAGIVISDDLGNAAQVSRYSLGDRATDFLAAGGDVVLTVDADQLPAMQSAVLQRMAVDAAFRASATSSIKRVLQAKLHRGLS